MGTQGRTNASAEQDIAQLASSSHGVVTRGELLEAGLTSRQIARRLRRGSLIRVHRGVYRVGHRAPNLEALYLAAVRACGERAVLSGTAAAHLWGLLKGRPPPPQVTAPSERRVDGITCRRCRDLDPRDTTIWRGVPLTAVPRTLIDLAGVLDVKALARACHEADVLHRTTPAQVEAALQRRQKSPGAAQIRRVLRGEERVTLSRLEARFLSLLRANHLPLPETNKLVVGRRLDCRWPRRRLVVELDGYRYHRSRHAWEEDRRRERQVRARGDEFRRYTWGDVFEAPALMLAELRGLLGG
jgi:very-short-patch-repair endonuclease